MKTIIVMLAVCSLIVWYVVIPFNAYQNRIGKFLEGAPPYLACGRLSDRTVEVSSDYFHFSPEYEGKSHWEPGFSENKKGCDANLRSLALELIWPTMSPALNLEYGPVRTPGYVSISLLSRKGDERGLSWRLNFLLDRGKIPHTQRYQFDENLGLYFVKNVPALYGKHQTHLYWSQHTRGVPTLIECGLTLDNEDVFSCEQSWFVGDSQPFIRIGYAPAQLRNWSRLQTDIEIFLNSHTKR